MNAQMFKGYAEVQRRAGAVAKWRDKPARTEAHFWGMVRDALNEEHAGENCYTWTLTRPHKYAMTGMPFALSRGRNRDEMLIDNEYAIRDVRALYNAGESIRLKLIRNI